MNLSFSHAPCSTLCGHSTSRCPPSYAALQHMRTQQPHAHSSQQAALLQQPRKLWYHPHTRGVQTVSNAASGAAGYPADANDAQPSTLKETSAAGAGESAAATPQKKTIWQHIKHFFVGEKLDKERLKALGMGAFASYGVISNLNYGTALTMAWLAFVKLNGVAPTAPGQWPSFLAFYAGFWAVQNFVRPLRISLALALAPAFDRWIARLGEKLNIPKGWAFGIFILGMGICTSTILFSTIYLLGGFPANTVPITAAA